jgi:putative CocE/NonD family hydrolase
MAWLGATLTVSAASDPEPVDQSWFEAHYTKHEHHIPMRDGARLFTAVYTPKDTATNYPLWLARTPYGLRPYGVDAYPDPNRAPIAHYAREGFIFVIQDARGCNLSDGEFVHMRPIRAHKNGPADTDEGTDTWDTIDWLVRNVPNNNGRVGLSGVSYPGFYAAAGAIDSHPALKAVSPQAPIVDQFIGDDFHHHGAFFLPHAFHYFPLFEPKREKPNLQRQQAYQDYGTRDGYSFYLAWESLAETGERLYEGRIPFWNDVMTHGAYDEFWQSRNLRPHLRNIRAAVLTVGGWFDAENLFGALEAYRHSEQLNPGITNLLVMGPWSHGQWRSGDAQSLGPINFRSPTAEFFRANIELPFFRHYLKDDPAFDLPEAHMFETGTCQWRRHEQWPPAEAVESSLFLNPNGRVSWDPPGGGELSFDEYISDPWRPVPYIEDISISMTRDYMVADQRFAARRPDVLVYQTEILEQDLTLAGPITASLHVSTTGTDSDWIVKVIDVYPDDHPEPNPNPAGTVLSGYQQLVRGEVMRGKFRNSYEHPEPFVPGEVARVEWTMPDIYHCFRRGHRLMVQVQSTWFPLVDRNPQVFCDIYRARPEDFQKATQRVYHAAHAPSAIRVHRMP